MKRTILAALPIAALILAGCSGNGDETGTDGGDTNANQTDAATAPRTVDPGAEPTNADQGEATVTSCEKDDNDRMVIEAEVNNVTEEKRTYILTGATVNDANEVVASAAIMIDEIEPGQSATGSGTSNGPVEGDLDCTIAQVESMPIG